MDSENLVSKLSCHVCYHLLDSPLLEGSFVESHGVQAFKSKSENASFSIFDSLLPVCVRLEVFLKFLLLLQVIFLTLINKKAMTVDLWLINPLNAWVRQLIRVNVHECWLKVEFNPTVSKVFLLFLPSGIEWRLLHILLRLIVVLELHLLEMGNFSIHFTFLSANVFLFNVLSVLLKLYLGS